MKRLLTILLMAITALTTQSLSAARRQADFNLKGTIVNEQNVAVEYATAVLLLSDSTQVTGNVSDAQGQFVLSAPKGNYLLCINCMGFEPLYRNVELTADTDMGQIALTSSATQIESVEVNARLITRQADRFVVDVANNPVAIGKNTLEMVGTAPGVWVSDDKIQINGRSGTRIMVNDRLLTNMTESETAQYLRSIPAENIVKIEVIPMAGADYDADSTGGVIKITVKKQRNDGMEGNVSIDGGYAPDKTFNGMGSARINYQHNKLNLYANGSWSAWRNTQHFAEQIDYRNSGNLMQSDETLDSKSSYTGAMAGIVYDLNSRSSIGAEYNFGRRVPMGIQSTTGTSTMIAGNDRTENDSYYTSDDRSTRHSVTVNYIYKLDSLGSTFKLLGDYASNISKGFNTFHNEATYLSAGQKIGGLDSLYQSSTGSDYRIYSLSANIEKNLSAVTSLRFGAKFSYNDMFSHTKYEGRNSDGTYTEAKNQRAVTDYVEQIPALYFIYSTRFKNNMALSAGLRGEYTYIKELNQRYMSLFPDVNFSAPLNQKQSVMLIAAYSRKISRPNFWALNPQRTQLSEYSYVVGNPDLKPTFDNDFSLTGVFGYKYTVTVGGNLIQNQTQQILQVDTENPQILVHKQQNIPNTWQYYVNLNAPIAVAKWWNVNINIVGVSITQQLTGEKEQRHNWMGMGSLNSTMTLPKEFYIDLSVMGTTPLIIGNQQQLSMQNIGITLKKRMLDNKLTMSLGLNNIFDCYQRVITKTDDFVKHTKGEWPGIRRVSMSLTYNFNSGKKFNTRSVEKGATEETKRLSSN